MRQTVLVLLLFAAVMLTGAGNVLAQESGQEGENSTDLLLVTCGFAMAIAAAGCSYAQSQAIKGGCDGVSRNPGAADTIRVFVLIGIAFIEFLALLTFVVVLMIYFGK